MFKQWAERQTLPNPICKYSLLHIKIIIYINDTRKGLHVQTVGREANSAQSCDEGIVAITEAALPR